jgi:HSP20 family protein
MTRDDDNLFDRLEEMLEEFGLENRFDELEERLEELKEQQQQGDSPFDGENPFGGNGNPFGGNSPFGGGGNPFGNGNPFGGGNRSAQQEQGYSLMSDVVEEEEDVVVLVDLPEFEEDQVDITADAERVRVEAEATDEMYHESVSQVFELPVEVEPSGAEADFENGLLTIRFPRVEPDDQTTITIE